MPVTFTEKLQDAPAARLSPIMLTLTSPGLAVTVLASHVPVNPLGVDSCNPDGSASVNAMPLIGWVGFGLPMVNVSVVEPFSGMMLIGAPNALVMVGGAITLMSRGCGCAIAAFIRGDHAGGVGLIASGDAGNAYAEAARFSARKSGARETDADVARISGDGALFACPGELIGHRDLETWRERVAKADAGERRRVRIRDGEGQRGGGV